MLNMVRVKVYVKIIPEVTYFNSCTVTSVLSVVSFYVTFTTPLPSCHVIQNQSIMQGMRKSMEYCFSANNTYIQVLGDL